MLPRSLVLGAMLALAMAAHPQALAQDFLGAGEVPVEAERPVRSQHGVEIIYGIEPKDHRVEFETEDYAVQSQERQEMRREVAHIIRIYRDVLGVRVAPDFGVGLEIYGDRRKYEQKLGTEHPSAGFYRHDKREAVVSGDRSAEQTHHTALHESSHAILMDQVPNAPRWLNEGLAEYFARLRASPSGRAYIPAQSGRHATLHLLAANDQLVPVEQLVGLSPSQWLSLPPGAASLAYTQAWSLVAFMMDRRDTRAQLAGILEDFRTQPSTSTRAALESHREGGLEDLEQAWRRWLSGPPREQSF